MTNIGSVDYTLLNKESILEATKMIPNLAAMHPDTQFTAFREFIPKRNVVEVTFYAKEPGKEKVRIDIEFDITLFEDVDLTHENVRIVYWGPVKRYFE